MPDADDLELWLETERWWTGWRAFKKDVLPELRRAHGWHGFVVVVDWEPRGWHATEAEARASARATGLVAWTVPLERPKPSETRRRP